MNQAGALDLQNFTERIHREGFFQPGETIYVTRSPGRLDLMGGNDDYTGGTVFEITIREATRVAVQRRADEAVRIFNPQVKQLGWEPLVEFSLADLGRPGKVQPLSEIHQFLNASPARAWIATIVGAIYLLLRDYPQEAITGLDIWVESDIPIGKGVSSSAALEVASLKAVAAAFGVQLEGIDLAIQCQWIENAIAQSASGIMDQMTVVSGECDHFVPLICQPCLPLPLVRIPAPLRVWGIDSGVRHAVSGIEYEAARAATFMGYQMICRKASLSLDLDQSDILSRWVDPRWNGYLANLPPSEFRAIYEDCLPGQISGAEFSATYPLHVDPYTPVRPEILYPVQACTRYAVEENHRVQMFIGLFSGQIEPLPDRTLTLLGELMFQSHAAYSECGLGSPATDLIVELVKAEGPENGLYGAKITGGGAGGTVAVLGQQDERAEAAFQRVVNSFCQQIGYSPYIFEGSSPGADRVGVLTN